MANSNTIPRFIKAKSERELERSLLLYQSINKKRVYVITIYPIKSGVICWFYDQATNLMDPAIANGE